MLISYNIKIGHQIFCFVIYIWRRFRSNYCRRNQGVKIEKKVLQKLKKLEPILIERST